MMSGMKRTRLLALLLAMGAPAALVALFNVPAAEGQVTYPGSPIARGAVPAVGTAPTPAALAAHGCPYPGAPGYVANQGPWVCESACPGTPDGVTQVVPAGDAGCWVRSGSQPGAGSISAWYVDSTLGNNANDCQGPGAADAGGGHGACADLQEIIRRWGSQPLTASPTIYLTGDFSGSSYVLSEVPGVQYQQVVVACRRSYTGWQGTVTNVQAWDGGAHLEGQLVVTPVDGGNAFSSGWTTADAGVWLEDTTAADQGGTGYLGIPIGSFVDAGTFYSTLGAQVQSFTPGAVTAGDSVRAYTLTPIATANGQTLQIIGGVWIFEDCQIGSASHSVSVGSTAGTPAAVEWDSCSVNGWDVYSGSAGYSYGSAVRNNAHFYGGGHFMTSTQFDGIESRAGGYVELSGWNLIGSTGVVAGNDGAGQVQIDTGPNAVLNYSSAALQSMPGGNVSIQAPFWARNSVGNAPAVKVWAGSPPVTYTSGKAPAYVGTLPTAPWIYGGTASDAGLPLYNTANGAGIVVQQ